MVVALRNIYNDQIERESARVQIGRMKSVSITSISSEFHFPFCDEKANSKFIANNSQKNPIKLRKLF